MFPPRPDIGRHLSSCGLLSLSPRRHLLPCNSVFARKRSVVPVAGAAILHLRSALPWHAAPSGNCFSSVSWIHMCCKERWVLVRSTGSWDDLGLCDDLVSFCLPSLAVYFRSPEGRVFHVAGFSCQIAGLSPGLRRPPHRISPPWLAVPLGTCAPSVSWSGRCCMGCRVQGPPSLEVASSSIVRLVLVRAWSWCRSSGRVSHASRGACVRSRSILASLPADLQGAPSFPLAPCRSGSRHAFLISHAI